MYALDIFPTRKQEVAMPKPGQNLPTPLKKLFRSVYNKILGENPVFNDIVEDQTTGDTDQQRLKSRLKAIGDLIRDNSAFRTAVRLELAARGVQWPLP
jgi:hypothetical protein